jgi:hypothetical protein
MVPPRWTLRESAPRESVIELLRAALDGVLPPEMSVERLIDLLEARA